MAKATSLLKAYLNNAVPSSGAFIVSSFFDPNSPYAIYEVTAYANVKDIFKSPEGLIFKTDGNRIHMLVEPASYAQRFTEPVHREQGKAIPYRFSELDIVTCKKQEKVMVAKEPMSLYSSFTILDNSGENFSFLFHLTEDVYLAIKKFMADSLYNDCNLTKDESIEGAGLLLQSIKKFNVWSARP